MKFPLIISILSHLTLIGLLFLLPTRPKVFPKSMPSIDIRWVSLVNPVVAAPTPSTIPPQRENIPAPKVHTIETVKPKASKRSEKVEQQPAPTAATKTDTVPQVQISAAGNFQAMGDIRVDNPNFTFVYYLNLIRYRIQENWTPPLSNRPDFRAIVGFVISRSGKIKRIVMEQASGNFLFDQSAQRAIQAITQLPPLPEEFSDEELTVHIEFEGMP